MVLKISAYISALVAIATLIYKLVQWVERQKHQDIEIANIKKEQCVMCYALFATLDGLKQLGANGNVTAAYNELEKYLNKSAH